MRCLILAVVLVVTATAHGADDATKATGTLDGEKVKFPAKGLTEGVKATIALLESCHDASDGSVPYTAADLKKAQQGDHVRLMFAKPLSVTVLRGTFEISELVFTQPLDTGVFWLRSGTNVVRCTKYKHEKTKAFEAWRRQAQPAD